jgi:hypothetical protein
MISFVTSRSLQRAGLTPAIAAGAPTAKLTRSLARRATKARAVHPFDSGVVESSRIDQRMTPSNGQAQSSGER